MGKEGMKGLTVFIGDIRACKSSEAELKRINKELANIRQKFGDKKPLDGYSKKKYVCKLVFMFLLGHEIEFGHMEAVNLLSSVKFSEKQIGYLFVSVVMTEQHELGKLAIQSFKNDLGSRTEVHVSLALNCLANVGGKEAVAATMQECIRLLIADEAPIIVRKKAALTLLHFYRIAPESFPKGAHTSKIVTLLSHPDYAVVSCVASLVLSLAASDPSDYDSSIFIAVNRLHRILMSNDPSSNYYYVPAPWVTVKLLRVLQIFPFPSEMTVATRLNECLNKIYARLTASPRTPDGKTARPKAQYHNAQNACFFEAINLLVHYDNDPDLQVKSCQQLGTYLVHKDVNLRFMALEALSTLATTDFSRDAVRKHQSTVMDALKNEKDPTVQRRAVDVLYSICDTKTQDSIVGELLTFLETAHYSIREELVLKIAILAEKFVTNYDWYVDVILRLIRVAGDFVPEQVWHRVIQIVINRQDVQDYASKTCYEALLDPSCHEAMVNVGGYVLGEFGHLIANDPNSSPLKQLALLQSHYPMVSKETRALLLSTYIKLANLFPEIKQNVQDIFKGDNYLRNADSELQQRANEYLQLSNCPNAAVLPAVLEEMPPFQEKESSILAKLDQAATITDQAGSAVVKRKPTRELQAVSAMAHGGAAAPSTTTVGSDGTTRVTNDQFFEPFILSDSGVLYENPVLQIGVKCEFHQNLGRVTLFYGNRGQVPMTNVTTRAYVQKNPASLGVTAKPIESVIAPGAQVRQLIQVECIAPFDDAPLLDVNLTYQGRTVLLTLKLPASLNKFLEPLANPMVSDQFFQKWNGLGGSPLECKNVAKAREAIDEKKTAAKLLAFGLPTMSGIDPKPENSVAAAILHTTQGQVGVLVRVEPNLESQLYRVTLRSSNQQVSEMMTALLTSQF